MFYMLFIFHALVSRICQCIDVEPGKDRMPGGVRNAVQFILREENTLFDDLFKNLENDKKLYDFIYDVLIIWKQMTYKQINRFTRFRIIQENRLFKTNRNVCLCLLIQ